MSGKIEIQSMIKMLYAALLVFVFSFPINPTERDAQEKCVTRAEEYTALFPASLLRVEEEAFYGTLIETVVFQGHVEYIGDKAFMDAQRLENAYIPDTVDFIGVDSFLRQVLIHSVEGSYVQKWAEETGFKFVADDIWHFRTLLEDFYFKAIIVLLSWSVPAKASHSEKYRRRRAMYEISMRPQDRIELYPINYRFP